MTTDFTSVVKWFFASVYRYTENVKCLYSSIEDKKDIEKTQQEIKDIEEKVYDLIRTRLDFGYNVPPLFKKQCYITNFKYTNLEKTLVWSGDEEKKVLCAYNHMIDEICEYYSVVLPRKLRVLEAIRNWIRIIVAANTKVSLLKIQNLARQKRIK